MFFPVRCMFWLTIVFTTIFSQGQAERAAPVAAASEAIQGMIAKVLGRAEGRVAEHCTSQPGDCLGAVARLSAMIRPVDASRPDTAPKPDSSKSGISKPDTAKLEATREPYALGGTTVVAPVPLPPPRPSIQANGGRGAGSKVSRAADAGLHDGQPRG